MLSSNFLLSSGAYSLSSGVNPQCVKLIYDSCPGVDFTANWTGSWAGTGVYANNTQCLKICQGVTGCVAYRYSDSQLCYTSTTIGSALISTTSGLGLAMLR